MRLHSSCLEISTVAAQSKSELTLILVQKGKYLNRVKGISKSYKIPIFLGFYNIFNLIVKIKDLELNTKLIKIYQT